MPGISQRKYYATIRGPSAEALDILAGQFQRIYRIWLRELVGLGVQPDRILYGMSIEFSGLAVALRKSTYPAFRQRVQEYGEGLSRRGVKLVDAVAALNRLYEICLPVLTTRRSKRASPVLALARLHALVGLLIVSGYTGQWASGKKTLVEASLAEAEYRRIGASAYVTRIYEQERRRLSHDLHDEVGHDLMLLKLYLEMMSLEQRDAAALQPRLAEAITLVSHAIDEVRRLVLDLGPAVFEDLGFLPAIKSYIGQFSRGTKINVMLREGFLPENIPASHQVALYRLLQGALANVLQHAAARNVKVALGTMRDAVLIMVVEDDGVGFDPSTKPGTQSFGLTAMRERVEVLGGKFHVQSRLAVAGSRTHGTRIEVDLPLPGREEQ